MKLRSLLAGAMLALCSVAAQSQTPPPVGYGPPILLGDAQRMIERGIKLGEAKKLKLAFAVVEPSGELVAFARMEDVPYAASHVAQQKARSAARFRLPTAEFESRVQGGRTVLLTSDEVIAVGGGVPVVVNGRVIGAIGVSGATAAEDAAIATELAAPR